MDHRTGIADQYERRMASVMTVLAVAFLFVYATPIIWTGEPDLLTSVFGLLNIKLWVVFVADLAVP